MPAPSPPKRARCCSVSCGSAPRASSEIMVPRADITAVEENEPLRELVLTFEEAGISRIPIYHETLDDPRGMIHIKDLFRWISAEVAGRPLVEPRGRARGAAASAHRRRGMRRKSQPISASRI